MRLKNMNYIIGVATYIIILCRKNVDSLEQLIKLIFTDTFYWTPYMIIFRYRKELDK